MSQTSSWGGFSIRRDGLENRPTDRLAFPWRLACVASALVVTILAGCKGSSPQPQSSGPGEDKSASTPHLAFVPPDAAGFAHVRVAKVWNSDVGKALRQHLPEQDLDEFLGDFGLGDLKRDTGLGYQELDSLTVVLLYWPLIKRWPPGTAPPDLPREDKGAPKESAVKPSPETTKPAMSDEEVPPKETDARKPDTPPPPKTYDPPWEVEIPPRGTNIIFVTTTQPYDRGKLREKLLLGEERTHKDKTYYGQGESGRALYCVNDRTFLVGDARDVRLYLDQPAKGEGPLTSALNRAPQHDVLVAVNPPNKVAEQLKKQLPPTYEALRPLLEAQSAVLTLDVGADSRVALELTFADEGKAKQGVGAVKDGLTLLRVLGLTPLSAEMQKDQAPEGILSALRQGESALRDAEVKQQGATLHVAARSKIDVAWFPASSARMQLAAHRRRSANNLRQIGIALHMYHHDSKELAPPAIYSKDGKPLLSWRVLILPYIEQNPLYQQFKLDEPWDSPHNKKLLETMPAIYAPVAKKTKEPYATYYQVFVGPGAVFETDVKRYGLRPFVPPGASLGGKTGFASKQQITLSQISAADGTSQTLMVVEAGEPVPWTKPDDIPFDPKQPLPKLGGLFDNGFHALFCDGSVRFIRKETKEATLRKLIGWRDAEVIDWSEIER